MNAARLPDERRKRPRMDCTYPIVVEPMRKFGALRESDALDGIVRNVSQTGLCVETPLPLTVSSLVRCQAKIDQLPVSLPLLLIVLWSARKTDGVGFVSGLQFLY